MTDKTHAMDRLIAQDADLIDVPTQSDARVAELVEASEGLKQDFLNRAKWAGAWLRFTTALAALQEQS